MRQPVTHLDTLLLEVGEFGRYQRQSLIIFMIIYGFIFFSNIIYVFEAKAVNHRCFISNCENESSTYLTSWLNNAVPFKDGKPERCTRFRRLNNSSCSGSDFNSSVIEKCDQFVYETKEISIMHDFNLHCDENLKKLSFVGTTNGIAKFIGLPIAGYISDKYGRKNTLIYSMVISGLFGLSRSFTTTYNIYLVFTFFESLFTAGGYASIYVLAAELVGPKKRVLINMFMSASYGLGSVILGGVAWSLQSWRVFIRIVYGLFVLTIICQWLIQESLRWLMTHQKHEEVKLVLKKIAKVNKRPVSYSSLKKLTENNCIQTESVYPIKELLKSKTLLIRCIYCSFCWISWVTVFYGLSITSVSLSGNSYLDFIFSCLIEIPACLFTFIVVDRIGRRLTLSGGFALASIFCTSLIFIPQGIYWLNLTAFLIGKFGIAITMNVIYMVTNEVFPTSLRQTLLSTCSMIGRFGNIAVPQLILLREIWKPSPFVIFAVLTGISGVLSICFPETKNVILPNTIEEAENIGKKKRKHLDDIDLYIN